MFAKKNLAEAHAEGRPLPRQDLCKEHPDATTFFPPSSESRTLP